MATVIGFADHHRSETTPFISAAKAALWDREQRGDPVAWRSLRGSLASVCLERAGGTRVHLRMYPPYREVEVWGKARHRAQRDLEETLQTPEALYAYIMAFG